MQKFYQVISLLSLLLFLLFKLNVTNFVGQEGASLLNRVIPVNYHFKFFLELQLSRIYKYKSLLQNSSFFRQFVNINFFQNARN